MTKQFSVCMHSVPTVGCRVCDPTPQAKEESVPLKEIETVIDILCEMTQGAALSAVTEDYPTLAEHILKLRQRIERETLQTLASAIKKVCPELIPQIIDAVYPEEALIRALGSGEEREGGKS